ncbi:C2H2 transcription factor [Histoplasma capsulatum var. duboisii H88]|uniref:C2H2 transcription factor n=1 Tax=Ajellomyces capsulatus (strain H88) TaxID=544711 RepID=A0A8A1LBI7_AJEC8|nr:C2H2 transcription factor [Histoplasma capsulatum var. duboisii H88]
MPQWAAPTTPPHFSLIRRKRHQPSLTPRHQAELQIMKEMVDMGLLMGNLRSDVLAALESRMLPPQPALAERIAERVLPFGLRCLKTTLL